MVDADRGFAKLRAPSHERVASRVPPQSDTVASMRIAGVRISAPFARRLAEIVEGSGFDATASKISEAIELQVTTEAPLTADDHEAILVALESRCPPELTRLRLELRDDRRRRERLR